MSVSTSLPRRSRSRGSRRAVSGKPSAPLTRGQDAAGYAALQERLRRTAVSPADTLVVLEATGAYWVALSAAPHNPRSKPFSDRLVAAGKLKVVARCAAARKLPHPAWALVTTQRHSDPTKPPPPPPPSLTRTPRRRPLDTQYRISGRFSRQPHSRTSPARPPVQQLTARAKIDEGREAPPYSSTPACHQARPDACCYTQGGDRRGGRTTCRAGRGGTAPGALDK